MEHRGRDWGLSSVLGFVKQSLGDLQIESHVQKGTTIRFVLPISTEDLVVRQSQAPTKKSKDQKRLLLVDDQDDVRMVLKSRLEGLGFRVSESNSAESAMLFLENCMPDVLPEIVLSDVRMPGNHSGVDLRNWISKKFVDMRVILMSGYSDSDSWSPDFLPKPFSQQELERALNRCK